MFRLIGRILLAIAAGLLIYTGITGIMAAVGNLNSIGWASFNNENYWPNMTAFGLSILSIVLGIPALYGFIRGKCGFWMFVFAAILGFRVGHAIYMAAVAGTITNFGVLWNIILGMLAPVCYALGTIFILLRRRGN